MKTQSKNVLRETDSHLPLGDIVKKTKKQFFGRIYWIDPSGSSNYDYENTESSLERLGYFNTYGLIDLTDKFSVVIIHDEEPADEHRKHRIRENSDIPRSLVIRAEEYMGKNKWKKVKI